MDTDGGNCQLGSLGATILVSHCAPTLIEGFDSHCGPGVLGQQTRTYRAAGSPQKVYVLVGVTQQSLLVWVGGSMGSPNYWPQQNKTSGSLYCPQC
jgi:hypothetical protein